MSNTIPPEPAAPATIPYDQFVAALAKPGQDMLDEMNADQMHALHMAIGISGEAGETMECICGDTPIDRVNLVEELGDLEFYAQGLRSGLGIAKEVPNPQIVEEFLPDYPSQVAIMLSVAASRILDAVKKWAVYQKAVDVETIRTELYQLEMSMAFLRFGNGISFEEVIAGNYDKLGKRYASLSYTNEAAIVRADKA